MAINKVVLHDDSGSDRVLVDLTGDSVTAETLMEGETAHSKTGELIVGKARVGDALAIVTVRSKVADMTPTEILAEYNKGKYIVCHYPDGVAEFRSTHYDLIRVNETEAVFEGITKLVSGPMWHSVLNINADKSVTFNSGEESRIFTATGTGAGGAVSGTVKAGGTVTGSWLQTTNLTKATDTSKIAVLDASGWVYYMTKSQLIEDTLAKLPKWDGGGNY